MPECLQSNPQQSAGGYLLILGCSSKKREDYGRAPALEVYDGPNFETLRKYFRENGWPPGLIIKIISAKYKIIDATTLIEPYDERLDKETAKKMRQRVRYHLKKIECPESVFVNMGKDYLPAVSCIKTLFDPDRIEYAKGGYVQKRQELKQWLERLPNNTATVNSKEQSSKKSYLYFFPDWDDYVYEPFHAEETDEIRKSGKVERKYAHEVFEDAPPYDGLLFSLAQLRNGMGPLNKKRSFDLRGERRIPNDMFLFGDCGAFSYTADMEPPFSPEYAASLYNQFDFNLGASVDHIPIPSLSEKKKQNRMNLTSANAKEFLAIHLSHNYQFAPVGSIQGITAKHYAKFASEYVEWGYKHIALGGLVQRKDSEILEIVAAVREALQKQTRGKDENIWVHLFGILRPNLQPIFRHLGVSSFDSASYLRKAWACPSRNYFMDDGKYGKWYSSIRVPFSTSKPMQEVAESNPKFSNNGAMQELETECLTNLKLFDDKKISEQEVLESVNEYSALLQRKKTYNHFSERHQELLSERPWKKCKCKVCKDAGINIVVFRGANRNRRRGFHNTWVFYHKILHGKHEKSSKK
ncbi:MAG: tRNA-guanine transglycosylase DpdA [Candidatus Poribacteria bacterium]|nr:tRNA-guanine transglycosylase DpdA [Candidatus Poribacteria bacterium]